ncbi:MAG TPA: CoB--CoM heterodisulfide reductase iron-sulfur subunit B family protein [Anaerolineae bacterium]|nr:CoB--CoM heterodisulfide reductase iron-sulfur subunit B family protein [Anaerolineae bacterium]
MTRQYAFYPGCTLHSTGAEFGASGEVVCEALGLEMVEIPDWNCCGASSAHSLDHELGLALPARNLFQAEGVGLESLAIPCAACYSKLAAAALALKEDEAFRGRMEGLLGKHYEGQVRPRSLLEVVVRDVPKEELRAKVVRPLKNLRVVGYYGCLLVRPPETTGLWDDPEHPRSLDEVVEWMGGEAVPWSYGVDCCGGSLTLNRSDVVVHLVDRLAEKAREAGADAMVTACPMCSANVDGRQLFRGGVPFLGKRPEAKAVPIFYFTELMALAYGLPMAKVLGKHYVDPRPLLDRLGLA